MFDFENAITFIGVYEIDEFCDGLWTSFGFVRATWKGGEIIEIISGNEIAKRERVSKDESAIGGGVGDIAKSLVESVELGVIGFEIFGKYRAMGGGDLFVLGNRKAIVDSLGDLEGVAWACPDVLVDVGSMVRRVVVGAGGIVVFCFGFESGRFGFGSDQVEEAQSVFGGNLLFIEKAFDPSIRFATDIDKKIATLNLENVFWGRIVIVCAAAWFDE